MSGNAQSESKFKGYIFRTALGEKISRYVLVVTAEEFLVASQPKEDLRGWSRFQGWRIALSPKPPHV